MKLKHLVDKIKNTYGNALDLCLGGSLGINEQIWFSKSYESPIFHSPWNIEIEVLIEK